MKLSELIAEYVDLKISGEPGYESWQSVNASYAARRQYCDRLKEIEDEIDATQKGDK